jgi:hypothetical protein
MRILIDGSQADVPQKWLQAFELMGLLSEIRLHTIAVAKHAPRTTPHLIDGPSAVIYYRGPADERVPVVPTLEEEASMVDHIARCFALEFMTLDYVEFILQDKDDLARAAILGKCRTAPPVTT